MDFLADLSALKEVARARPDNTRPVPRSESVLLQKLKQGEVPYAHCAWCEEVLPTRSMLEQHYYSIHHVVFQPSCCAPPSVFQTIMGKELQLRQRNFNGFSSEVVLRNPIFRCPPLRLGNANLFTTILFIFLKASRKRAENPRKTWKIVIFDSFSSCFGPRPRGPGNLFSNFFRSFPGREPF